MKALASLIVQLFLFLGLAALSGAANAQTPPTPESVAEQFAYRKRVDSEAAQWARDLMYKYEWQARYPLPTKTLNDRLYPEGSEIWERRLASELAWLSLLGDGLIASFDYQYAQQSLLGSRSRFMLALRSSIPFWNEVKARCEELRIYVPSMSMQDCAERLRRDLELSQAIGSNISLFLAGGLVVNIGKRVFQRYLQKWVVTRLWPVVPAMLKTKWAAAGVMGAIIILPAGFVVASINEERRSGDEMLRGLQDILAQNKDDAAKQSIMKMRRLEQERKVIELSLWLEARLGYGEVDEASFLSDLKFLGPHYRDLYAEVEDLEVRRKELEDDLSKVPALTEKLRAIVAEKARLKKSGGKLGDADAELLRKAQYLAALRVVIRTLRMT